jgi:hypothetical protein
MCKLELAGAEFRRASTGEIARQTGACRCADVLERTPVGQGC